jgi:hypothetical protein
LHVAEGTSEVLRNLDAFFYDKMVALCKRKIKKGKRKLHGPSGCETGATLRVSQIDAFQDQRQFRRFDLGLQGPGMLERRYVEPTLLDPLVIQTQAAAVPQEDFDSVAPAIEENEQMAAERIFSQDLARHGGQAVERSPHVGRGQTQEHAYGGWQRQHDSTTEIRRDRICGSNGEGTRITRRCGSTTSYIGAGHALVTGNSTNEAATFAGRARRLARSDDIVGAPAPVSHSEDIDGCPDRVGRSHGAFGRPCRWGGSASGRARSPRCLFRSPVAPSNRRFHHAKLPALIP